MRLTATSTRCLQISRLYSIARKTRRLPKRSASRASLPRAAMSDQYANSLADVPQVDAAWQWFNSMGAPKYWVAPMVDQSELPFRMLCRNHGATAAYTPMLHARLFMEGAVYRNEHFTTCEADRPLLTQFCANDPEILLAAAKMVEDHCDGIDVNLGCPQRIARRGRYGAYLMDHLDLVESLVRTLSKGLKIPVTVKIRRFDDVDKTVAYAAMLERAGAYLVAVHGRTREQKRAEEVRACWDTIAAVKKALRVPVLANGNLQSLHDVEPCLTATGCHGVLSAESLLCDPALFAPRRLLPGGEFTVLEGPKLLLEYVDLCEQYPVPYRMMKGHAFKLLGPWLTEFVDLRDELNMGKSILDAPTLRQFTQEVIKRIEATGRDYPIAQISAKKLAKMEAEAALAAAIAEQNREEEALQGLELVGAAGGEKTATG